MFICCNNNKTTLDLEYLGHQVWAFKSPLKLGAETLLSLGIV